MVKSSIWLIYETNTTISSNSWPESDRNDGVLHFPLKAQILKPDEHLILCHKQDTRWKESSTEMQSAYSTVPADWAALNWSLTPRYSLVSYPRQFFKGVSFYLFTEGTISVF